MNRKPVIAFVLPDLTVGGAEMVMARLVNALPRDKYDPVFIAVSSGGTLKDFIDPSIPFHSLDAKNVIAGLPKLFSRLKEIQPDIVIATMAHMNFGVLMLRPFLPKTKFIVRESTLPECTLHGRGAMAPVIRILYRALYPLADKIIAPARIILEKMNLELGVPAKRMALLPNPVDVRASGNIKGTSEKIRFIAAGRLHPEKGFDRLIKALKDYRGPDWHLTILGEGSQREHLEYMIESLKFSGKVSLPGFSKEPWAAFAAADCFLLPSRWEGLPNAALEALACGIPVIALKEAGGIVEIAGEAPEGAVTVTKDILEFTKAMAKVTPSADISSLLPDKYRKENVMQTFDKLLQEIL